MSSAIKNKKRTRPTEGPSITAEIELALSRKKALDAELLTLERQIYALETSYLENTALLGDLIRGWGDFTNPASPGGPGGSTVTKKKKKIHDHERIFSSSSVSALKNPEFHGLSSAMHTSTTPSSSAVRAHHAAVEDEADEIASSLTFDMDVDTPSRPKPPKRTPDASGNHAKKASRTPAPRTTPKVRASSSLLDGSDGLALLPNTTGDAELLEQ